MINFMHIGIGPDNSLFQTAKIIEKILGGLNFLEDKQGIYEEYPAFIAERNNIRYSLLGVPSPEYDLREEQNNDFELIIEPLCDDIDDQVVDISSEMYEKLSSSGEIKCWLLE